MLNISFAVAAHEDRADSARQLAEVTGARIAWDDGRYGQGRNHDRAWKETLRADPFPDWCVVLEDDAVLATNFMEQLPVALWNAGASIVSLYLGTSKPETHQPRIEKITARPGVQYIDHHELRHAVAVAIRATHVPDMLNFVEREGVERPADYRIGRWARSLKIPVTYTNPSLVDHADGPTLVQHFDGKPRTEPRVAHNFQPNDQPWRISARACF